MADGDVHRRIKITASGENIDSTAASARKLGEAVDNTAKSADRAKISLVDAAAGAILAKTAYDVLDAAATSVGKSTDNASASLANGARAVANYLPKAVSDVWQEGVDKLNRYVELSQKAGGLGTDFYQALTLGAATARKSADEYLNVVQNINKALDRQLGASGGAQNGSGFNAMVLELQKNGNLQGQGGNVNRLNNAVTSPEQLAASLKLIQGALDAGEKLVAFKLAGTLLGPEAAENLKRSNDYIFQMQKSIENVQGKDIIKQADIDRAAQMKTALEEAFAYLDSRNKKEVSDWSGLGVEIQQLWVNAVTQYAGVMQWLDKIFARTKDIAEIKPASDSFWLKVAGALPDLGDHPDIQLMTDADHQKEAALARLRSGLGNSQNVINAGAETQKASDIGSPDLSSTGAYAKATDEIKKYIEATNTAAAAVNQSAADQQRAKVEAQLLAAALAEGLSPALAQAAVDANGLAKAAGDAAEALDKAQKMKAGTDALTAALTSAQGQIKNNEIEIQFNGQAGAIARAKLEANLYTVARKTMSDEDAKALVAQSGLGKAIEGTTDKLAALNKKPEARDAYDRATESLLRYIEVTSASAETVGLSAAAQEKAKAIAQLTAAALKDGLSPAAAKAKAEMSDLGDKAAEAAGKLALAKVAAKIDLGNQTRFLSPEDVAIANELAGVFGNNIPLAMASSQAASLRLNNTIKTLKDAGISFTTSLVSGLLHGQSIAKTMASAFEALGNTLLNSALTSLLNQGLNSLLGSGGAQVATSTTSAGILEAGGVAAGAAIIAAATTAANILGLEIPVAAATLPVAGAVAGTEVEAGGLAASIALITGADAASIALYGPIALLLIAIAAIGAAIGFSGNDKDAEAKKKAEDERLANVKAWEGMTKQVREFNEAAAGFKIGNITSELRSLFASYETVANGAAKAQNWTAVATQQNTFNEGVSRLVQEFVNGKSVLTDYEQGMKDARDEASGLKISLNDLALLSDQAAAAIDGGLIRALAKVKAEAEKQLGVEINAAQGKGYLNDFADEIQKFNALSKTDIDQQLLSSWFKITAQKIVDDSDLAGSAIADLIAKFPELAGVVTDSASSIQKAVEAKAAAQKEAKEKAISVAQEAVNSATQALTTAYQAQSSALQSTIDRMKSFISSLREFATGLKLNSALSVLDPRSQYLLSQSKARADAALAAGGDTDAQGRLQQDLSTYLEQSKSFNASTEAYYADFMEVQAILASMENSATKQLTDAQQQLAQLKLSVKGLIDINDSVLSVVDAINNLQDALSNLASAKAAGANNNTPEVNAYAQASPYYTNPTALDPKKFDANGNANQQLTQSEYSQWLFNSFLGLRGGGTVPGYADGGTIGNGIYDQDSVFARLTNGRKIALAGGEHVTKATSNNASTAAGLAYINSTGKMPSNDRASLVELGRIIAEGNKKNQEALAALAATFAAGSAKIADETRKAAKPTRQTGTNG